MVEKTCFRCGEHKNIADFYTHPRMADGHLGKCKSCTMADVRAHRAANRERLRDYDTTRSLEPSRAARMKELRTRWRCANRDKLKVYPVVARAIRSGVLQRAPCEACGAAESVAHHDDYSKPLAVRWLCPSCHRRHHSGTLV
jgi:ribosomal protein S27AE